MPIGAVVGRHHRVKESGLCWECRWTTTRRRRDKSLYLAQHQALGTAWGMALDIALPGHRPTRDRDAILKAAWRACRDAGDSLPTPEPGATAPAAEIPEPIPVPTPAQGGGRRQLAFAF